MTKLTDLDLKIVPVRSEERRMRGEHGLTITNDWAGKRRITLRTRSREALGKPRYVQLLVAGPYIVVRACSATEQHARKVSAAGDFAAGELIDVLGLVVGERIVARGEMDANHLIVSTKNAVKQPIATRKRPVALKDVAA